MRDRKGFTLIELLIVVVIIGILAAIAIPKFAATREKAYRSTMLADLRNLASLQELYYSDNYSYSTDATLLGYVASSGVTMTISDGDADSWAASATHTGLTGETCTMDSDSPATCTAGGGS
jgi:prepilin-type N-terminal cleavage/methylation domain-containing protein